MDFPIYAYLKPQEGKPDKDCLLSNHTFLAGRNLIYRDETVDGKCKFVFLHNVKEAERYYNAVKDLHRFPRLSCYTLTCAPRKICLDLDMPVVEGAEGMEEEEAMEIYINCKEQLAAFMAIYHADTAFIEEDVWTYSRHRPGKWSFRIISPYVLQDKIEQDWMIEQLRDMMGLFGENRKILDKYGAFMQSPDNYKVVDGKAYCMRWDRDLNEKPDEPEFNECQMTLFDVKDKKFGEYMILKRIAPKVEKTLDQQKLEGDVQDVLKIVRANKGLEWAEVGVVNDKGFIPLTRTSPSVCPIHERVHDHIDGYLFVTKTRDILQGCYCPDPPAEGVQKCVKVGEVAGPEEPRMYYSDYTKFQELTKTGGKKDWAMATMNRWVKDSLAFVDNEGNHFIMTYNRKWCHKSKTSTEHYETLKPIKLLQNLDLAVNILNPYYDEGKPISKTNAVHAYHNLSEYVTYCMKNRTNLMRTYSGVCFEPYTGTPPELGGNLNLFTSYAITSHKPTRAVDFSKTKTFAHWRDAFCDGNEETFQYLIKYLAQRVQDPGERPDVAIVIQSDQGMGKDLMRRLMTKIFGTQYILAYQNIGLFFKNFNTEQCGKIMTFLNEVSDRGDHFNKHDQFKGEITKDDIRVEPKGMEVYNVNHCSAYIAFSQHEGCLYVENSCRRLCMLKANNEHANDHAYFLPMWDEMHDNDVVYGAYEYLMGVDLSEFTIRNFPMTNYKKEQLVRNLSAPIKFMIEMGQASIGKNPDRRFEHQGSIQCSDGVIMCRAPALWDAFNKWCDEAHVVSKHTRMTFYEALNKVGIAKKTSPFKMGADHLVKGYRMTAAELEVIIGDHLKLKTFSLTQA